MSLLYIDSSAFLKRYLSEDQTEQCEEIILSFTHHCISNIGLAEISISLKKRLGTRDYLLATRLFDADLSSVIVIPFDQAICSAAIEVSNGKNLATLDSIHIASALRFKENGVTFLTYDRSQGLAAKRNGLTTLGAVA